jgi:molybdopterin synthase catalytic subunit
MPKTLGSMDELIRRVKEHPDIQKAGMILCHNGIVRSSDRSGEKQVVGLTVTPDRQKLEKIRAWGEKQPGIVAVLVEAAEGDLRVGDDLLYVVVAGDVREHVLAAMGAIVDRIKAGGVTKAEEYAL